MKKIKDYIILILLLTLFVMIFKYSSIVKGSILDSIDLWLTKLVPSMLPIYLTVDLLINYGLPEILYKITKSHSLFLLIISYLTGTPSNAKYISEFYKDGYIEEDTGNLLLLIAYSPNPLFVLAISPNIPIALYILGYLYITNAMLFLIFHHTFKNLGSKEKRFSRIPFIECLSKSIMKSFDVLILVLGVVVFFGILNSLIGLLNVDSLFLSSILEMTNGIKEITLRGSQFLWLLFAITFGGLSIHAQIKSILESTNLSYRYFFIGRLLVSIPIIFFLIFA